MRCYVPVRLCKNTGASKALFDSVGRGNGSGAGALRRSRGFIPLPRTAPGCAAFCASFANRPAPFALPFALPTSASSRRTTAMEVSACAFNSSLAAALFRQWLPSSA